MAVGTEGTGHCVPTHPGYMGAGLQANSVALLPALAGHLACHMLLMVPSTPWDTCPNGSTAKPGGCTPGPHPEAPFTWKPCSRQGANAHQLVPTLTHTPLGTAHGIWVGIRTKFICQVQVLGVLSPSQAA